MSGNDRSDVRAFEELEQLVRHLGEQLATFRRRALQAEQRLKDGGSADAGSQPRAGSGDRLAELEQENATLRDRLSRAEARVTLVLERVHFMRQQAQLQPARDTADGKP